MTTDEDVAVAIRVLEGASDPEGDALTVTRADAPGHGVEVMGGETVVVTPMANFHGTFRVNYTVSDGSGIASGHAIVTVLPVNDAPTARGRSQNIHGKVRIVLEASDVDGDALTYEIVGGPARGTLSGVAPALEYEAEPGFVGDDAFTYRALDGKAASEPATIALHVLPGSPPSAQDGTASGTEDTPLVVTLRAMDPDGDRLTYTIVAPPAHGTLEGTGPDVVYTPAQDFHGSDSLQFSVHDGYGPSNIAVVILDVAAVNDPPVANPQAVATSEDTERTITLQGSDVEGASLSFEVVSLPLNGTLAGSGSTWTYKPKANYHGPDSFRFEAREPGARSAPATVTIEVASIEDVPVAEAASRTLAEDSSATIALTGRDGDGDPVTFAIVGQPAHGTLDGPASAPTYTPHANYHGPDSFAFTVSDGDDTSVPASVTLTVASVNDAPVASDSAVATNEDTSIVIGLPATDVDHPTLSYSIVSPPADGTLTGNGASRTYRPATNASGARSFRFRVSDGAGGTAEATVTIAIQPVNDPPATVDDFAFTEPGSPITLAVVDNDTDIEGDALELDTVEPPAHGSAEVVDGELRYTPEAGFTGVEILVYTAVDAQGGASTGRAHVGVGTFPPGAPMATIATIGNVIHEFDDTKVPAISSDGRVIAFVTFSPLVNNDTNGWDDIYVFDRGTHSLSRVSVRTGGGQSNGLSLRPHLSADGRYVVFDSEATNLVTGDTNQAFDVFRHDRVTGETIRVSVSSSGGQANGHSWDAEVADDGNLVVFRSSAFDLTASDANGATDIFVRDGAAGTTTRVSVTASGGEADLASMEPTISGDGRFVAFTSASTNLVAGDSNGIDDVFVRDRVADTTTRISVSSTGTQANAGCARASMSRDGRFISFQSSATNLVGGAPPPAQIAQVYVRDVQQQTTTRPRTSSNRVHWSRLSADGRYVTAFDFFGVYIRDRFAGTESVPSGASSWMWPMISGNGRYIVALESKNGTRVIVTPNPL